MAARFASYLATKNGKRFSAFAAITGSGVAVLSTLLPNSLSLNQVQEVVQLYRNGFPVAVPKEVLDTANQVKIDMNLDKDLQDRIAFFTVYGFDIFHCGAIDFGSGAIVGVPANFSYTSPKNVDRKNILVGNKTVHWTSPDGISLESSLLLSESAQKFAIAREICMASNHRVVIQSALNGFFCLFYYYLTYSFNRRAKMFEHSLKRRIVFYSLLGSFIFTLWLFIKDFMMVQYEQATDERVTLLGDEYAKGGVEFYTKILQRNVALRSILDDEGAKLFTAFGNDHTFFRTRHVPYTVRRDSAIRRYEALTNKNKDTVATGAI